MQRRSRYEKYVKIVEELKVGETLKISCYSSNGASNLKRSLYHNVGAEKVTIRVVEKDGMFSLIITRIEDDVASVEKVG